MLKRRRQALEILRAEARTLEAERDRLLEEARDLEVQASLYRKWLTAALDLAEEREQIIGALEVDLADTQTALDIALQGCIDREVRS